MREADTTANRLLRPLRKLSRVATLYACLAALLLAASCATSGEGPASEKEKGDLSERPTAVPDTQQDAAERRAEEREKQAEAQREEEKVIKEEPKQLERRTFYRLVWERLPERFLLLRNNDGTPVSVFHDLDRNGYEDGFFLLLDRREAKELLGGGKPHEPDELQESKNETDSGEKGEREGNTDGTRGGEAKASSEAAEGIEAQRLAGESEPAGEYEPAGEEEPFRVTVDMVSDISSLLDEERNSVGYYLAVFLQREDGVVSMYRLPLGSWKVFDSFGSLKLNKSAELPYSIKTAFHTQEGTEHHWVIFSRYDKFDLFSFTNTISTHYEVRDIDGDQLLDILEWNKVFEEGTGYETYITWYRLRGSEYLQYKTTNVVRNLNSFLGILARRLEKGRWDRVIEETVREKDRPLFEEAASFTEAFSLLFRSEEKEAPGAELRKVVFPTIFENPFYSKEKAANKESFDTVRFSVRFIFQSGESQMRSCEVGMSKNPFEGKEFFLVPKTH